MTPSAGIGFILAIVGGLLMIIAAARTMRRTDAVTGSFVVFFCVAMLTVGIGFLLRADDLPVGSLWFVVSITAGLLWIGAAAFYGFVFRRMRSRNT